MSKTLNNIATILLVGCALTVTGLVIRREFFLGPETIPSRVIPMPAWKKVVEGGRWIGPKDAKAQVAVFLDFECPPCRMVKETLDVLLNRHSRELALVLFNFPLKTHPHAYEAAMAAECAGFQNSYAAYHDALFMNQSTLGKKHWSLLARLAGIPDVERFEECVQTRATSAIVDRDIELASEIGVDGTPTLIVNGRMINGNPGVDALDRLIREAISEVGK
jgi:protein-disulfide isomerase